MEHTRKRNSGSKPGATTGAEHRENRPADDSSFALLRDNITEALRILLLRRWVFFVPFCLVTCLAAFASHRIPRTYRSTTSFERRDHPVLMNLRQTAATGGFASFFRPTLSHDLTAPDAMCDVVANLGLVDDLPRTPEGQIAPESLVQCEAAGSALAGGISIQMHSRDDHLDQIQVTYTGFDPRIAQRLVDEVKNTYIRRTRSRMLELLHEVRVYFDTVAREERDEIATLEEDLLRFEAEYVGVDPTNPGALKLKLTSLESEQTTLARELNNLTHEIAGRRRLIETYRRRGVPSPANVGSTLGVPGLARSPEAVKIEDEIRRLQSDIHGLQITRRMTEQHPDVIDLRQRIARLQELLKVQYLADAESLPANRGVSLNDVSAEAAVEAHFGWDAELAAMELDLNDREQRLTSLEQRLSVVEEDIDRHEALQANIYKFRKDYNLKSEQITRARTDYNENIGRVVEIDRILNADESERGVSFTELVPATPCYKPVTPRSGTVLTLSMLGGLAAGAIAVLLKELFDQTYRTAKQVTRGLGLTILESIDEIVTSADRARFFRRRIIYAPAVVTVLLLVAGGSCALAYLSIEKPQTYQRLIAVPQKAWGRITNAPLAALEVVDHPSVEEQAASAGNAPPPAVQQ